MEIRIDENSLTGHLPKQTKDEFLFEIIPTIDSANKKKKKQKKKDNAIDVFPHSIQIIFSFINIDYIMP